MATFKAIVFQTGRHIKQDGTSNIKIRIYHNRESQYIATSYYIQPGIPNDAPLILKLKAQGTPVISEIEFAGRYTDAKMITASYFFIFILLYCG